jgi:NAD(P)-dependent dehydrogenase (short-subunit alcohol dehydrogenase family)
VFDDQRLDGKVVIVTGATQGLGAAIARRAHALGASLVITGRDEQRGAAVAGELDARFVAADLEDPRAAETIVGACDGRLDGLVNAAGLSTRGTIDDTSVELWDRLFAINASYSLQPDRIRVNGLNIGWTATEGENTEQTGDNWLAEADASRPFGRLLRPDDIAPMVTYLLSDAAQMVTGSVIDFDQTVLGPYGAHVETLEVAT